MNYRDTFITVATDCPVDEATTPHPHRGRPTVATIQYELLADAAYTITQEDVLFLTYLAKQEINPGKLDDREQLRAEYFAVPRACLRASPLPKQFGWGIHFDGDGRAALHGVGSARYLHLSSGSVDGPTVVPAMRTSRR